MKNILYTASIMVLFLCHYTPIYAQNTSKIPSRSVKEHISKVNKQKYNNLYYLDIEFQQTPSKSTIKALDQYGIQITSYRHNNIYQATISTNLSKIPFEKLGITNIVVNNHKTKISKKISSQNIPAHARNADNAINTAVIFNENLTKNEIDQILSQFNVRLATHKLVAKNIRLVTADLAVLEDLAQHPAIQFIDIEQAPDEPINQEVRGLSKANVLNSHLANGYGLTGEGITVGVGDGGELGNHIDFDNRKITDCSGVYSGFGAHPDHVSGIIAGAGHIDEQHKGIAPDARLVIQKTSLVTYYTEQYFNDYEMVLTNNSYGSSSGNCNNYGSYNYTSHNLDKNSRRFPKVLHVFAAGNSGFTTCSGYPQGFRTVLSYYQSAKNVLTVGNVKKDLTVYTGSSKGPVLDGRLKPEICGIGTNIYSTGRDYNYFSSTGTSMAAPGVTGILALMNEAYRKTNNNEKPDGALLKAIACNTAQDIGNPGPDYSSGFGLIDGKRAVDVIQANQFYTDLISENQVQEQTLEVAAGLDQLNVLLYWHDVKGDHTNQEIKSLVNDLDIEIIDPQGQTIRPWILNPAPAYANNNATRGIDTLNNIEQITIPSPTAGTYTIKIKGTKIPVGPQKYVVTYDKKGSELLLTYPFGEENFTPNTNQRITWSAAPNNTTTFGLDYSIDNGTTWTNIAENIDAEQRMYDWSVPNSYTTSGMIRVRKGNANASNQTVFNIISTPSNFSISPLCQGYLQVDWDGESNYGFELSYFNGQDMIVIDTLFGNTSNIYDDRLSIGTSYSFALNVLTSTGQRSKRTVAIQATPQLEGDCTWSYDITIANIMNNLVGRKYTSIALSRNEPIQVQIVNNSLVSMENINVFYQVEDQAPIMETINTNIPAQDTLLYTFSSTVDFSSVGNYNLNIWLNHEEDTDVSNDSIRTTFTQLSNNPMTVEQNGSSIIIKEDFEELNGILYNIEQTGLDQLTQWDFQTNSKESQVKFNNGALHITPTSEVIDDNYDVKLVWTLNLEQFRAVENLYLNFQYINDTLQPLSEPTFKKNQVWVRGNDQNDWILLTELDGGNDEWKRAASLSLSDALRNERQNYSSSFQIQFKQLNESGLSLDNVSLSTESPLPVDFGDFNLEKDGDNNVLISWKTISETNNSHFDIELAVGNDAAQEENFKSIGTVLGNGTTNITQYYSFEDNRPNKSGHWFYRLKQTDFDGNYTYSDVKTVSFPGSLTVNAYPNPFQEEITVNYQSLVNQTVTVELIDSYSKVIYQETFDATIGGQEFTTKWGQNIAPGVYYLKLNGEDGNKSITRIIKIER